MTFYFVTIQHLFSIDSQSQCTGADGGHGWRLWFSGTETEGPVTERALSQYQWLWQQPLLTKWSCVAVSISSFWVCWAHFWAGYTIYTQCKVHAYICRASYWVQVWSCDARGIRDLSNAIVDCLEDFWVTLFHSWTELSWEGFKLVKLLVEGLQVHECHDGVDMVCQWL